MCRDANVYTVHVQLHHYLCIHVHMFKSHSNRAVPRGGQGGAPAPGHRNFGRQRGSAYLIITGTHTCRPTIHSTMQADILKVLK